MGKTGKQQDNYITRPGSSGKIQRKLKKEDKVAVQPFTFKI